MAKEIIVEEDSQLTNAGGSQLRGDNADRNNRAPRVLLYANGLLGLLAARIMSYWGDKISPTIATPSQSESRKFREFGFATIETTTVPEGQFDIVLSCNWPKIFDENFCTRFFGRCFNLHASHNLCFRGRYPNIFLIRSQNTHKLVRHGVCIHRIAPELDSGEIVLSEVYPVDNNITSQILDMRNRIAAGKLINEFIQHIVSDTPFLVQRTARRPFKFRMRDLGSRELERLDTPGAYDLVRSLDHDEYERAYIVQDQIKHYLTTCPTWSSTVAYIDSSSRVIYFDN